MNILELGFAFLLAQTTISLVAVFWYTLIFEVPRYILPFLAAGLAMRSPEPEAIPDMHTGTQMPSISIILVGHNEEDSLEACVRSLHEQSISGFEIIIVSDGSTDKMIDVGKRLVKQGLASHILSTDLRGGKASGINLACAFAKGDIIINVDCDCSFDRFAIEYLLEPFGNPKVGAVCGDIAPRNSSASIITQFQEIEYLQSISVGKRIASAVNQVVCASGAFSAFRRIALNDVGGFDVGGGEDLDVTIRFRLKGWLIEYAPDAICYTDVPVTAFQYIRQRLRWERDAIWIRFRKHRRLLNPMNPAFQLSEAVHQWDYILFNVIGAVIFPVYLIWLMVQYGSFAPAILIGMQVGLLLIDLTILAISAWCTGRNVFWRNVLFLPGYSLFMTYVMRPVRLIAYIDEWVFSGSHRDNYTPIKVRLERPW
ncbi:glycosyltransferase family 2 protein [Phyllobacterium sp. P30BS-XVII]|uniref:glycosyltransferase n=1 Tax=Phyllobacterium sp. P30BS-XVII TaxID=2587046 RepID=UPI000DD9AB3D|nr:cellulose synthase/poly-beta-1,6-N-acetylglucosamine synthase-like glycosyltransferase [Phyllobacterium sp. P30BS-XVII]